MLKKRYHLFCFIMPLIIGFLQVASFESVYGWLGIFLYSALFYIIYERPMIGFLQGYIYGFVYFTIHSWGCTQFIDVHGFAWYYKGIPIVFFLIHAIYTGLWGMMISMAKKHTKGWLRYILYVHITGIYMWWLHCKSFSIFGIDMGYPLFFPFTPCIHASALTYLFYTTGMIGATYSILMMNGLLTYIWDRQGYKYHGGAVGVVILVILLLEPVTRYELAPYNPTDEIIRLKPAHKDDDMFIMIDHMRVTIQEKLEKGRIHKNVLIAFPESALPFSFSPRMLRVLPNYFEYDPNISIMMGGFYQTNNNLYNSIFLLQNSRIILHYDKRKLLPFWEFTTSHTNSPLNTLFNSFLTGINPFSWGSLDSCSFFYFDNEIYLTSLCSELFWSRFTKYPSHVNLMCLLNDSHFEGSLLQKIMLLYGRFIAGTQRRKVCYIAHSHGWMIGKNGSILKKL